MSSLQRKKTQCEDVPTAAMAHRLVFLLLEREEIIIIMEDG